MLNITPQVNIPDTEIDIQAIRAQGAGGQNVNKVSSAIHLRFDISASSLPDNFKQALLNLSDKRISKDGIIIIKAQQFRSQDKNRMEALNRLQQIIKSVAIRPKKRMPTRPPAGSKKKRIETKTKRGHLKELRGKVEFE